MSPELTLFLVLWFIMLLFIDTMITRITGMLRIGIILTGLLASAITLAMAVAGRLIFNVLAL